MSNMSNVETDKILSAAKLLEEIASSIHTCTGKIADSVETLDHGWVSSVKAEFMLRYQKDWEAMQEMHAQYNEIIMQLKEMVQDIDKTEQELISRCKSLG
jgi:uncharacterized protein YukE